MVTAEISKHLDDTVGANGTSATPCAITESVQYTPGSVVNGNSTHARAHISERDPISGLVNQWHSQPRTIRIIHVGAGATGLCAAYKMRKQLQNYELVCYEKNPSIGGTWLESMVLYIKYR